MAYKLVNKTNGNELTKYNKENLDFDGMMFFDNIDQIKQGKIAVCTEWEQVMELLDCFDNNDDFTIEEIKGAFCVVQPEYDTVDKNGKIVHHNGTTQYNLLKKLKSGEIIDFENEKD